MATAFYGTLTIKRLDGRVQVDRFDSADTDASFVTWKSSGGNTFLNVIADGYITDIVLNIASAGTTKDFKIWLNQTDTNIRFVQSACFPAVPTHFPNLNPIPVSKDTVLMLQALA